MFRLSFHSRQRAEGKQWKNSHKWVWQSVSHGCCSSPPSLFQSISQTYYTPAFSFQTLSIFVSIFLYHFTHTPILYFISPVFPSSCGRLALFLQTGCTQFGEARVENHALQTSTRRLYICYRLVHLKKKNPSRFGEGNSTQNTSFHIL